MNIRYLGHSCFKLEKNGYSIVIDPYEEGSVPGYNDVDETANMVLCSHTHFDHNNRAAVAIVDGPICLAGELIESCKNSGFPFTITTIDTYHDHHKGGRRGMNTIHIIDDGDMRIAHLGDLGFVPCGEDYDAVSQLYGVSLLDRKHQEEMLNSLRNLDAILVPVGGYFTISAKEAAALVNEVKPRQIIPMHYRGIGPSGETFGYDNIETADEFMQLVPNATLMMPELAK